ncbi:MAG: ABC transporter permease [Lachnospiraceae bacterium]|jgi:peptide/nickel transport system permease protein|nr:ABC transporter permease [Lachnospiraceae bacterium]
MDKKRKRIRSFFSPAVIVAVMILAIVIGGAILANVLAPYDPNAISLGEALQGPSLTHWLGTDPTGRDIFSRLLFGGRTTLLSAVAIVAFAMLFGIPLGLFAGYYGGWFDKVTQRICDVIIAFPSLLLAFVFVAAFGRSLINSIIAIGIIYIPMTAKLTRSLTLTEKNKTYVEAGRTIGYSRPRILFTEILPNCVAPLTAQLTLDIGYAVLDLAAMSFLGLGVQPPTADWGAMLEEGQQLLFLHPMGAVAPGIAIALTVIAINLISDGVLRYIDPAQRRLPRLRKKRLEAMVKSSMEAAVQKQQKEQAHG